MTIDQRIIQALTDARIDYNAKGYDPAKTFRDNGIDSLDVMSLLLAVEEKFGIKFSDEDVNAIKTPAAISAELDRRVT